MSRSVGVKGLREVIMDTMEEARAEIKRLQQWVNDLQAGMYVNCVYCGHRYGPEMDTPVSMAEVLKQHIEVCPQHPLSSARARIAWLEEKAEVVHDCLVEGDTRQALTEAKLMIRGRVLARLTDGDLADG